MIEYRVNSFTRATELFLGSEFDCLEALLTSERPPQMSYCVPIEKPDSCAYCGAITVSCRFPSGEWRDLSIVIDSQSVAQADLMLEHHCPESSRWERFKNAPVEADEAGDQER